MHGYYITPVKNQHIWKRVTIIPWLFIFLSTSAHYLGCYDFIQSWCSSLTYDAATEPRALCVLPPYDCATRCALVPWSVIATPRQYIFRNLSNVLVWILFWFDKK